MIVRPHICGVRRVGLRSQTIWPHSLPPQSNTRTATFSATTHTPSGTAARAGITVATDSRSSHGRRLERIAILHLAFTGTGYHGRAGCAMMERFGEDKDG